MVEQSNPDSGASKQVENTEPTANQPVGNEEKEEQDTGWGLEPAPPLDQEGEASLAAFLQKV